MTKTTDSQRQHLQQLQYFKQLPFLYLLNLLPLVMPHMSLVVPNGAPTPPPFPTEKPKIHCEIEECEEFCEVL